MDSVKKFSAAQLNHITKSFAQENLLGYTQFGRLYRAKIKHESDAINGSSEARDLEVTVKIWEDPPWDHSPECFLSPEAKISKLKHELYFLQHPTMKDHPNLVKVIGYCSERGLFGVVYDLNPLDTLHNLILKDNFSWLQRIKVALGFARLLAFLHDSEMQYMVRNVDAAHIMIDKDFNPILFDFGMLSGGIMGDLANTPRLDNFGCVGYIDLNLCAMGRWSVTRDVFSYGVILLSIIAKRVVDKANPRGTLVATWAQQEYKPKKSFFGLQAKCSLVHKSLEEDPAYDARDGLIITKLGMRCLKFDPRRRPTMKEIVQCVLDLRVVRKRIEAATVETVLSIT